MRVAVVDTGVDFDHPDLRGRIVKAQNFVDRGEQTFTTDIHGTAVAGVIAADGQQRASGSWAWRRGRRSTPSRPAGRSRRASREAVCNSYTLAQAVDFAIGQRVQVLNLSLAGPATRCSAG